MINDDDDDDAKNASYKCINVHADLRQLLSSGGHAGLKKKSTQA